MHNVTLSRIYKDGEEWKDSNFVGRDDVPLVAKVVDRAHDWIYKMPHDQRVTKLNHLPGEALEGFKTINSLSITND